MRTAIDQNRVVIVEQYINVDSFTPVVSRDMFTNLVKIVC
jgi:hypothetical protein